MLLYTDYVLVLLLLETESIYNELFAAYFFVHRRKINKL